MNYTATLEDAEEQHLAELNANISSIFEDYFASDFNLTEDYKPFNWSNFYSILVEEHEDVVRNSRIDPSSQAAIVCVYAVLIVVGVLGNASIIYAFLTSEVSLTARNIFIANLAVADCLLCGLTMPLTLMDLISEYWSVGPDHVQVYMCKMMGSTQESCLFFSSFSIILIVVDRYRFIVHPQAVQIQPNQAFMMSGLSLLLSMILSLPIFINSTLEVKKTILSDRPYAYCFEAWSSESFRLTYTVMSCVIQFVVPSIIVIYGYSRICRTLSSNRILETLSTHRRARQLQRRRRTNILLVTVSVVFFVSWAPLNIFNILLDFSPLMKNFRDESNLLIAFSVVHICAMVSACINPIVYGYLNENFKASLHMMIARIPIIRLLFRKNSVGRSLQVTNKARVNHNLRHEEVRVKKEVIPLNTLPINRPTVNSKMIEDPPSSKTAQAISAAIAAQQRITMSAVLQPRPPIVGNCTGSRSCIIVGIDGLFACRSVDPEKATAIASLVRRSSSLSMLGAPVKNLPMLTMPKKDSITSASMRGRSQSSSSSSTSLTASSNDQARTKRKPGLGKPSKSHSRSRISSTPSADSTEASCVFDNPMDQCYPLLPLDNKSNREPCAEEADRANRPINEQLIEEEHSLLPAAREDGAAAAPDGMTSVAPKGEQGEIKIVLTQYE